MTGGWKGNPEKWADLKSTSSVGQGDLLQDVKVRLESKWLRVFVLTERETGDAPSCDGAAEDAAGVENMRLSSCFGRVKGEHPCGDRAGRWLNGLGGEGRVWLEMQSLESLACGGTHVTELNGTYRSKCR